MSLKCEKNEAQCENEQLKVNFDYSGEFLKGGVNIIIVKLV